MANIALQDIDEQIAKLQELRKIIADPQISTLLNQILASKNGNTATMKRKAKKGTFIEKIEETCRAFGTAEFTVKAVIEAFQARGYTFAASNKSVAAYSAMRRLQERKVIQIVKQGIGSSASTYRVVQ